jgi:hypothetical protein
MRRLTQPTLPYPQSEIKADAADHRRCCSLAINDRWKMITQRRRRPRTSPDDQLLALIQGRKRIYKIVSGASVRSQRYGVGLPQQ